MSSISPFALLLNYPLALMNALNSLRNEGVFFVTKNPSFIRGIYVGDERLELPTSCG
jgi:hypothetical protein